MTCTIEFATERLERGLSQEEIAAEIGVSVDVYRNAERTGRRPHPGNARKFAVYFERRVTDIWPVDTEAVA